MEAIYTNPGLKIAMLKAALKILEWYLATKEKRKQRNKGAAANESQFVNDKMNDYVF